MLANAAPIDAAPIDVLPIVAGLLGGLALFLFGVDRLTDALRAAAAEA
jgi:hypothetical protein